MASPISPKMGSPAKPCAMTTYPLVISVKSASSKLMRRRFEEVRKLLRLEWVQDGVMNLFLTRFRLTFRETIQSSEASSSYESIRTKYESETIFYICILVFKNVLEGQKSTLQSTGKIIVKKVSFKCQ